MNADVSAESKKVRDELDRLNGVCRDCLHHLRRNWLDAHLSQEVSKEGDPIPVLTDASLHPILSVFYTDDTPKNQVAYDMMKNMRAWTVSNAFSQCAQAFVIHGQGDKVTLYAASSGKDGGMTALHAAFPGIIFGEDTPLTPLVENMCAVGAITGVPAYDKDEFETLYSLDVFLRGMRGKHYSIIIFAVPCTRKQIELKLIDFRRLIGENSSRIKRQMTNGVGESETRTKGASVTQFASSFSSESVGSSTSTTITDTKSDTYGGSVTLGSRFLSGTASYAKTLAKSVSSTVTESIMSTTGSAMGHAAGLNYSVSKTKNRSFSHTMEEQNRFAYAYDEALTEHEKRLKNALDEGLWRMGVYVLAKDKETLETAQSLFLSTLSSRYDSCEPFRALTLVRDFVSTRNVVKNFSLIEDENKMGDCELSTLVTSSELAAMICLPLESHTGVEVRSTPRFSVLERDMHGAQPMVELGKICDREIPLQQGFFLCPEDLQSHTLVAGLTGMGKSTTIRHLLASAEVPFLVLEPAKSEYRTMPDIRVYTAGDDRVCPLRLNPFELAPGDSLHSHLDALSAIINAAFPMEGPMASLVELGLLRAYANCGWDTCFGAPPPNGKVPTMDTFYEALEAVIAEQEYAGDYGSNVRSALLTRINTLRIGPRGRLFNSEIPFDVADLLSKSTVIEMKQLGNDETKAFLCGILLQRIYKYYESQGTSSSLRGLLVVEEAHRIFRRAQKNGSSLVGNDTAYHSVQIFENIMSEIRAYGLGMVIAEQLPLRLSDGAIKNTNLKIVHRLGAVEDAACLGGSMGMSEEKSAFICRLPRGEALVHAAGCYEPAHVRIPKPLDKVKIVTDAELYASLPDKGMSEKRPSHFWTLQQRIKAAAEHEFLHLANRFYLSLLVLDGKNRIKWQSCFMQSVYAMQNLVHSCIGTRVSQEEAAHLVHSGVLEILREKSYLQKLPSECRRNILAIWDNIVDSALKLRTDDVSHLKMKLCDDAILKQYPPPLFATNAFSNVSIKRCYPEACQFAAYIVLKRPDALRAPLSVTVMATTVAEMLRAETVPEINICGSTAVQFALGVMIALFDCCSSPTENSMEFLLETMRVLKKQLSSSSCHD